MGVIHSLAVSENDKYNFRGGPLLCTVNQLMNWCASITMIYNLKVKVTRFTESARLH